LRSIEFRVSSLDDLRDFPEEARREAGYQLDRIQNDQAPDDWKPMPTIGAGVREIRIWAADGTFRVIYVTKFKDRVFVLHCFRKTSQKTARPDLALAARRYKDLVAELSS
jgi:phage-related protein